MDAVIAVINEIIENSVDGDINEIELKLIPFYEDITAWTFFLNIILNYHENESLVFYSFSCFRKWCDLNWRNNINIQQQLIILNSIDLTFFLDKRLFPLMNNLYFTLLFSKDMCSLLDANALKVLEISVINSDLFIFKNMLSLLYKLCCKYTEFGYLSDVYFKIQSYILNCYDINMFDDDVGIDCFHYIFKISKRNICLKLENDNTTVSQISIFERIVEKYIPYFLENDVKLIHLRLISILSKMFLILFDPHNQRMDQYINILLSISGIIQMSGIPYENKSSTIISILKCLTKVSEYRKFSSDWFLSLHIFMDYTDDEINDFIHQPYVFIDQAFYIKNMTVRSAALHLADTVLEHYEIEDVISIINSVEPSIRGLFLISRIGRYFSTNLTNPDIKLYVQNVFIQYFKNLMIVKIEHPLFVATLLYALGSVAALVPFLVKLPQFYSMNLGVVAQMNMGRFVYKAIKADDSIIQGLNKDIICFFFQTGLNPGMGKNLKIINRILHVHPEKFEIIDTLILLLESNLNQLDMLFRSPFLCNIEESLFNLTEILNHMTSSVRENMTLEKLVFEIFSSMNTYYEDVSVYSSLIACNSILNKTSLFEHYSNHLIKKFFDDDKTVVFCDSLLVQCLLLIFKDIIIDPNTIVKRVETIITSFSENISFLYCIFLLRYTEYQRTYDLSINDILSHVNFKENECFSKKMHLGFVCLIMIKALREEELGDELLELNNYICNGFFCESEKKYFRSVLECISLPNNMSEHLIDVINKNNQNFEINSCTGCMINKIFSM